MNVKFILPNENSSGTYKKFYIKKLISCTNIALFDSMILPESMGIQLMLTKFPTFFYSQ